MNHHEIALIHIYIYIYTYHCGLVLFVTPQILANMEQSKDYGGSIQTIHKDTQATPSSHRFLRWSRPAIFNGWEKHSMSSCAPLNTSRPQLWVPFQNKQCPPNCCMNHHEIALIYIYIHITVASSSLSPRKSWQTWNNQRTTMALSKQYTRIHKQHLRLIAFSVGQGLQSSTDGKKTP